MLRLLYSVLQDFGTPGLVVAFGCLNFYWIYKIATNHLAHQSKDISAIKSTVETVRKDVKDLDDKLDHVCNRVSKLEGKVENLV